MIGFMNKQDEKVEDLNRLDSQRNRNKVSQVD